MYYAESNAEKLYRSRGFWGRMSAMPDSMTPASMLDYCEKRIQGQGIQLKKAVYKVYKYMQAVAAGEPFQAENWFLTSPSGTGKTEFYRTIKDLFKQYHIPIPVVQIDLSQITETGYKGANVSTIPQRILSEYKGSGGVCICFLDEADKKCIPSYGSNHVNNNAAVQANLLTLLEGMEMKVEVDDDEQIFDSNKTMFVLLGSFQELRDKKQEAETESQRIGFWPEDKGHSDENQSFYEELSLQDMIDFGMKEELAGRIVSVINFHKLSQQDMLKLMKDKVREIGEKSDCSIVLKKSAEQDFLKISFGNLGIRQPVNTIQSLVQDVIAEVFFDGGFDKNTDRIVIDSPTAAHIEHFNAKSPSQVLSY